MSLDALPWDARVIAAALQHGGGRLYVGGKTDDRTTDCVRLTYAVLLALYGARVEAERAALMLYDPSRPWSPPEAVHRLGIGKLVDAVQPGCWHLVQGWVSLSPLSDGHGFLWYEPMSPLAAGTGVQVQANSAPGSFVEDGQTFVEQVARYTAGVRIAVLFAEP